MKLRCLRTTTRKSADVSRNWGPNFLVKIYRVRALCTQNTCKPSIEVTSVVCVNCGFIFCKCRRGGPHLGIIGNIVKNNSIDDESGKSLLELAMGGKAPSRAEQEKTPTFTANHKIQHVRKLNPG